MNIMNIICIFLFKRSYLENILVVVCNYVCKCLATLYVTCFWEMYFVFACSVLDVKIVMLFGGD